MNNIKNRTGEKIYLKKDTIIDGCLITKEEVGKVILSQKGANAMYKVRFSDHTDTYWVGTEDIK